MSITPEQLEKTAVEREPEAVEKPAVEREPEAVEKPAQPAEEALVTEDLLVEDVSIDGMCGVY